jgi:hypothetical protein
MRIIRKRDDKVKTDMIIMMRMRIGMRFKMRTAIVVAIAVQWQRTIPKAIK